MNKNYDINAERKMALILLIGYYKSIKEKRFDESDYGTDYESLNKVISKMGLCTVGISDGLVSLSSYCIDTNVCFQTIIRFDGNDIDIRAKLVDIDREIPLNESNMRGLFSSIVEELDEEEITLIINSIENKRKRYNEWMNAEKRYVAGRFGSLTSSRRVYNPPCITDYLSFYKKINMNKKETHDLESLIGKVREMKLEYPTVVAKHRELDTTTRYIGINTIADSSQDLIDLNNFYLSLHKDNKNE